MTSITKKAWFAIPVSVTLHLIVFLVLFFSQSWKGAKQEGITEPVEIMTGKTRETDILVDTGWKRADEPGINKGLRNQAGYSETPSEVTDGEAWKKGRPVEGRTANPETKSGQDLSPGNTDKQENKPSEHTGTAQPGGEAGMYEDRKGFSRQGSFQLSSYEWDYAPYMSAWIRTIQREWIEPLSYIAGQGRGGRVMVKVEVTTAGKLKTLDVLYSNVNKEMTESAVRAVMRSFDRPGLPQPFPDSVLAVTFSMVYPVL